MSGSTEGFVALPPDGAGKQVDAFQVSPALGATYYRQTVVLGDPAVAGNVARIDASGRLTAVISDNGGLLDVIGDDLNGRVGATAGLVKQGGEIADGSEPSLVVQLNPNSPVQVDQTRAVVVGGIAPGGAPLQARVGSDGGFILSDATTGPQNTYTASGLGTVFTLDTSGSSSIVIEVTGTFSGSLNFYTGNDPYPTYPAYGLNITTGLSSTTFSGAPVAAIFVFPATGRYFRCAATAYTSGQFIILPALRTAPMFPYTANITAVGNAAIAPAGSAAGSYAVPAAAIDTGGIARRITSDSNGNLTPGGVLPVGYQVGAYNVTLTAAQSTVNPVLVGGTDVNAVVHRILTNPFGAVAVAAAPSTTAEQSISELLLQLTASMRVMAHYLYEIRNASIGATLPDEPDVLLKDYLDPASAFVNMVN